ncbi:type II toxin-antitoxin system VapC family toxin [Candidatus Woesearchaeota archaeon]|nr:type II toxin-antitoxin system VapC family toxin [Candidatus Woesearchaeota archaeon]
MKYYLDTAIWRDYYENRSDKYRPLGDWALELIKNMIDDGDFVLYSEFVLKELKIKYTKKEIEDILNIVNEKDLLIKVDVSETQIKEAVTLSKQRKIAFGDALHAILARDNNAILISRDKHYLELLDIVDCRKPEDLI